MFHAPQPGKNLAIGRIEYVEVLCCINDVLEIHLGLLELCPPNALLFS